MKFVMDTSKFWFRPHVSRAEGQTRRRSFQRSQFLINPTGATLNCDGFSHVKLTVAEALVKDKEAGTFVVRDSTSYRGSFGLAMKVDRTSTGKLGPLRPE